MTATTWEWPGSRWWKCDLHVHTPGSYDQRYDHDFSPADWVLAAIGSGLDAIAVTDHNSADYIEKIKELEVNPGLAVFPGVELTVANVHILALFDPTDSALKVQALLGRCEVEPLNDPRCATAKRSVRDVLDCIEEMGGIAVAAHIMDEKGILHEVDPGVHLQQIITSSALHAVEINNVDPSRLQYLDNSVPGYVRDGSNKGLGPLARLRFSDAHCAEKIGYRSTWIKMTRPTLGGLRLALQDGDLSVDCGGENPNRHSELCLESIEVTEAKLLGRGQPFVMQFNPWLNCIIGGRGTGKSSVIEFLRISMDREQELPRRLREEFHAFKKLPQHRKDSGVLTSKTALAVIYRKQSDRYRLTWYQGSDRPTVETMEGGQWVHVPESVQFQFPVRIYSQRQIFELTNDPSALLSIVDDAPAVNRNDWNRTWEHLCGQYFALKAELRLREQSLREEPEINGRIAETMKKIQVFDEGGHKEILADYQGKSAEREMVKRWTRGVTEAIDRARGTAIELRETISGINVVPAGEGSASAQLKGILGSAADEIRSGFDGLVDICESLRSTVSRTREVLQGSDWWSAALRSESAFKDLLAKLKSVGIEGMDRYTDLVSEMEQCKERLQSLDRVKSEAEGLRRSLREKLNEIHEHRRDLTKRRSAFLASTLRDNQYVRMEIHQYGNRAAAEEGFRQIISKEHPLFQPDIFSETGEKGLIAGLYRRRQESHDSSGIDSRLLAMKELLQSIHAGSEQGVQDRRFAAHIRGLPAEAFDKLDVWYPEDSLDVSYQVDGSGFRPIEQGSAGQRAASILAFLLSYGDEPLVIDQPEDDLDNRVVSNLIVDSIRQNKYKRQIIVATHNSNIVVNGDAEMVFVMDFLSGQNRIFRQGGLQDSEIRSEICRVMEGGQEAFERRFNRIGARSRSASA